MLIIICENKLFYYLTCVLILIISEFSRCKIQSGVKLCTNNLVNLFTVLVNDIILASSEITSCVTSKVAGCVISGTKIQETFLREL